MSEGSALDQLQARFGFAWPALVKAREEATRKRSEVIDALDEIISRWDPDLGIVVCGSLAREEWTSGSDIDWSLLVDGGVNGAHLQIAKSVEAVFEEREFKKPNPRGAFGNLVFSHNLVHLIGGESDTNTNTTQRVLLLLESISLNDDAVRDRVIRAILDRYLEEDTHFRPREGQKLIAPRFLVNDIVRYWRTIGVDYASKHRAAAGRQFALRNIKLRLSRKLIFVAGLLTAFACHFDPREANAGSTRRVLFGEIESGRGVAPFINRLMQDVNRTPLEILARVCLQLEIPKLVVDALFRCYDQFLHKIDDPNVRQELATISYDEAKTSQSFNELRDISHEFQTALIRLFFDSNDVLKGLMQEYAIF